ncbi:MAG TPA: SPFH domain-containing protein [Streptosporangiaceae bacterium]|nr:SPFH domain-containing protein [Streptosporangiaceae bacterium]
MPFLFVIAIVFGVFTLIAAPFALFCKSYANTTLKSGSYDPVPVKEVAAAATTVLAVLAGVFTFLSMITTVSTQNIGIVTEFGKPVGYLSNGWHLTPPWAGLVEIDGRVQTDTYKGDNCITVRIAHQQNACLDVSVQWRINPKAARALFKNYGTFARIQDGLVTRQLDVALNEAFATFDPIASLTSKYAEGTPQNPTSVQLARTVASDLQAAVDGTIEVKDVLIPTPAYEASVQARINKVLGQAAQTDIALQAVKTAEAQAAANRALAQSVSNDPGVLESRCLDLLNEAITANYALPAGFSCSGPSSVGIVASGK